MSLVTPSPSAHARRAICSRCARPERSCICRWITPIEHEVQVVILQHPLEEKQAKGSARLAHLCLTGSRLYVGEQFSDSELDAILRQEEGADARHIVLLYPETPESDAGGQGGPVAKQTGAPLRLIVLDATWRKSRKMLYLNPRLAQLPRLALKAPPPSRYHIRRAHQAHQLSTLEAIAHALSLLEGRPEKFQPLLDAFDGFVDQQLAWRPPAGAS